MERTKRRPYSERMSQVAHLLSERGALTVLDVVLALELSPNYARQLLRWAEQKYPYTTWDEQKGTLAIKERLEEKPKKEKKPK